MRQLNRWPTREPRPSTMGGGVSRTLTGDIPGRGGFRPISLDALPYTDLTAANAASAVQKMRCVIGSDLLTGYYFLSLGWPVIAQEIQGAVFSTNSSGPRPGVFRPRTYWRPRTYFGPSTTSGGTLCCSVTSDRAE
jgi:hypothetical protein